MVKLRRIGAGSAAKVGFWLGIAMSFCQIIVALLILFFVHGVPPTAIPLEAWIQVSINVFISSLAAAFSWLVFAMLYNWSANVFGGLELEFEMPEPVEKMKNGESEEIED